MDLMRRKATIALVALITLLFCFTQVMPAPAVGEDVSIQTTETGVMPSDPPAIGYMVNYDTNGGTPATIPSKPVMWNDADLLPTQPTRPYYSFTGWKVTAGGRGIATAASKYSDLATDDTSYSITLTAQWVPQLDAPYTVEYYKVVNGAATLMGEEHPIGQLGATRDAMLILPYIEGLYPGYTFDPTYPDSVLSGIIGRDDSLTIRIYYRPNTYSVSFNAGGGSGSLVDVTATFGEAFMLPANSFTKEGSEFVGWDADGDGKVDYNDEQSFASWDLLTDLQLTAVWRATTSSEDTSPTAPSVDTSATPPTKVLPSQGTHLPQAGEVLSVMWPLALMFVAAGALILFVLHQQRPSGLRSDGRWNEGTVV
ncbi:MAG: InlB B-repeat-containing protein [Actinomycetia bacterium]|nr:InlB B-repeat-containing protein [Actinomycetes bacterium]